MLSPVKNPQAGPLFAPFPPGRFKAVVVDPPWDYSRKLSGGGTSGYSPVHHSRGGSRGAANHYKTLRLSDLKALPIQAAAAEQSHLYVWTTGTFLAEAFELAEHWGFAPKGVIPWIKTKRNAVAEVEASGHLLAGVRMGMGLYVRWCSEFVVFGVRGKLPSKRNDVLGVVLAERGRHSEKPEEFYELVRSISPGPRLDVFARQSRKGFTAWGDEAEKLESRR
jgi:N6-adenosine-specific RNA methylase IME4